MEPTKYKVNTSIDDLRIRKTPSLTGELTGITKKHGSIITVIDQQGDWSKIDEGWVFTDLLLKVGNNADAIQPDATYKFAFQPIVFPEKDKLILRTAALPSVKGAMFGMTRKYPDGRPKPHQGIDLEVPPGEPIFAVENGEIVDIRVSKDYGKVLCLKVTDGALKGKFFFYAHLNGISVKLGNKVRAGDQLGLTGSTGNAINMTTVKSGSHLHFEARTVMQAGLGLGGRYDPLPYIRLR
jgi:murein DD-endopeptidase MepM/ murein hydrolase activator NlpD